MAEHCSQLVSAASDSHEMGKCTERPVLLLQSSDFTINLSFNYVPWNIIGLRNLELKFCCAGCAGIWTKLVYWLRLDVTINVCWGEIEAIATLSLVVLSNFKTDKSCVGVCHIMQLRVELPAHAHPGVQWHGVHTLTRLFSSHLNNKVVNFQKIIPKFLKSGRHSSNDKVVNTGTDLYI